MATKKPAKKKTANKRASARGSGGVTVESATVSGKGDTVKLTVTLKLGKLTLKNLDVEGRKTRRMPAPCTGCADSRATSGCP